MQVLRRPARPRLSLPDLKVPCKLARNRGQVNVDRRVYIKACVGVCACVFTYVYMYMAIFVCIYTSVCVIMYTFMSARVSERGVVVKHSEQITSLYHTHRCPYCPRCVCMSPASSRCTAGAALFLCYPPPGSVTMLLLWTL